MNDQLKINWYRSPVDRAVMSELMRTSDLRGFLQVIPQLALFAVTGALAYAAFLNVSSDTWPWAVPLLLGALSGSLAAIAWMAAARPAVQQIQELSPVFRTIVAPSATWALLLLATGALVSMLCSLIANDFFHSRAR
jgi:uncharacterized transporter YbjL